jgi:maleamate amidohydrolase
MSEALDDNYERAGYHHKTTWGKSPALLMVDFAQAYFEPSSPLYAGVEDALASALRVRTSVREAGMPVFLTRVEYVKGGADGGRFFEKVPALSVFEAGGPLGDWPAGLLPEDDEMIITKQYPSAFFGTSLAATMTASGIDTVLVTGLTTSGCVRASCLDALCHGFIPVVISDACGDRDHRPHEANLFDMSAKYADVITETEAIDYINRLAEAVPA